MEPWTLIRSRVALAHQRGEPPERIAELRRDLRTSRAALTLAELMASDPPPTPEQRRELASLLSGGDDAAA